MRLNSISLPAVTLGWMAGLVLAAPLALAQGVNEAGFYDPHAIAAPQLVESFPRDISDLTKTNPNLNDKISFVSMGDYTRAMAFENTYYGGACITFSGSNVGGSMGTYELIGFYVGTSTTTTWDNRISSLIIRDGRTGPTCTKPGTNEAVFWQNDSYGGAQFRMLQNDNYGDLRNIKFPGGGNWNDSISSLKLGPGVRVLAWEDVNYQGRCITFAGSAAGGRTNEFLKLSQLNANLSGTQNWNDRVSSLKVTDSSQVCPQ
jgi:hypothetical protein